MSRNVKEFVRIATLQRHHQDGLVSAVEIIDDEEGWSVCVHYTDRAKGPKTRFLTSKRLEGAKRFARFSTAWKMVESAGIDKGVVRKATAEEREDLCMYPRTDVEDPG